MSVHAVVGHQFEDDTTPRRKAQPATDDLVTSNQGKWVNDVTYVFKAVFICGWKFFGIIYTIHGGHGIIVYFLVSCVVGGHGIMVLFFFWTCVSVGRKSSKKVTTTLCKKTSKSFHPSPGLLDVPFGFINAGVRSLVKKLHLKSRGEVGSWKAAGKGTVWA